MGNLRSYLKVKKQKKAKRDLILSFDKIINLLDPQIDIFDSAIQHLQDKYQTKELPIILNQFIFFKITFKDIIGSIKQLHKTSDTNELNLITRSLALHLYEFLDDTQDFLGHKMREELKLMNLPNIDFLIKDLNHVKEIHKAVKNATNKSLADVRHNTVAHKEQNSLVLNGKIKSLNQREIEMSAILSFTLFIAINHFQNNIIKSISYVIDEFVKDVDLQRQDFKDKMYEELKLRSTRTEFNKTVLIFTGTDPLIADAICEFSKEELDRIISVLKDLSDNLNNYNVSTGKNFQSRP